MFRLTEVPDSEFCGCKIYLGVDLPLGDVALLDEAATTFSDLYSYSLLGKARITKVKAGKVRKRSSE